MSGVGITYLWPSKEFPTFIRLEGIRGDYEIYTPERTCFGLEPNWPKVPDELPGTDCPAWQCSECNELFEKGANYCSRCGAKVINNG